MRPSSRWIRRTVVAFLLLAIAVVLLAYPIPPKTLWGLTDEAELVVVARVEAIREVAADADQDFRPRTRARLAIVETLKGEADGEIEVSYMRDLICPAPAQFFVGHTVVAFLARDAETGSWYVPHLSYGTLYPRDGDLPLFRDLISRAISLQAEDERAPGPSIPWLVEAASHRATRWHGLYEIAAGFDTVHSFYDRGSEREDLRSKLTHGHLARIARGFVEEPSADLTFAQTLGVLAEFRDSEFDRVALELIEAGLAREKAPYWLDDALEHALRRFSGGDERVEKRLLALGENSWDRTTDGLRELWNRTKIEHGVPDVEPLDLAELEALDREVWGVGGTTPP